MMRELLLQDLSWGTCLWQSTAFLMLGLFASYLWRRHPSRAYHVLLFAMASAVVVPLGSAAVKHFGLGLFVRQEVEPAHTLLEFPASTSFAAADAGGLEVPLSEPVVSPSAEFASARAGVSWRAALLYAWAVATFILLGRFIATFIYGIVLVRHAYRHGSERIQEAVDQARSKIETSCGLQVRASESIRSPVVWCWSRRPILLVPQHSDELDVDWTSVITHELAHCLRRDHITGALGELATSLLPWHPLMWMAKRYLVRLGEQACDDWVVACGQPGEDYAEALLHFRPQRQMAFLPGVVHSKKGLAARVRRILSDACGNPRTGAKWALTTTVLALCAGLAVAFAQARPAPTETTAEQKTEPAKSLHEAVAEGDVEQVKLLISRGADVNARDKGTGWTPIFKATNAGHAEVVRVLLDKGASADTGDARGYGPICYAIWNEDMEMVQALVAAGADINRRFSAESSYNAFFEAIWMDNPSLVKWLMNAGADVNYRDGQGWLPLHWAMHYANADVAKLFIGTDVKVPELHKAVLAGNSEKVKQLIEGGVDADGRDQVGWTPSYWAVSAERTEVFEYLLAQGADVNAGTKDGRTLLHQASRAGNLRAARLLAEKGAVADAKTNKGETPLLLAAYRSHQDICQLLISSGADVNAGTTEGRHPLGGAAAEGHMDIVKFLLANGARVDLSINNMGTALLAAALGGQPEIVDFLIAKGANVHVNARGTALCWAARGRMSVKDERRVEVVKRLLAHGADVRAKDPQKGQTPLHLAAFRGRLKTARILIAAGADVNAKDSEGRTPLALAQQKSRTEVVELLRQHGAKESVVTDDIKPAKSFHEAAREGDLEQVKKLISAGADIDVRDKDGATPLQFAAHVGQTEVVRFLLANGADVNCTTNNKGTALDSAAWFGHLDMMDLLIEAGADVNAIDSDGWTPVHYALGNGKEEAATRLIAKGGEVRDERVGTTLHLAAQTNCFAVVEQVLARGQDVNAKDRQGNTPLHMAAESAEKPEMVELLVAKGADVKARNNKGRTPLHGPFWRTGPPKAELLIAQGADVNARDEEGLTPLHLAARMGLPELAQILLANGAQVNAQDKNGVSPVYEALRETFWRLPGRHLDVVDLLLANGAESSTIHLAAYAGDLDKTRRFVEQGIDVNAKHVSGLTPLQTAAKGRNEEVLKFLIAQGAEIDAKGYKGRTALHYAANTGRKYAVEELLARGADVNAECATGRMPLHYAAFAGHRDVVQQLITRGAEIDAKDALGGSTPLYYAMAAHHEDVVQLLLDSGVDVHVRRVNGSTPLHLAAKLNQKNTAELLLARGADVNARDNQGRNPLKLATGRGEQNEVAELLLKHGAEKW